MQFHTFGPLHLPVPLTLDPPPFFTWKSPIPPTTLSWNLYWPPCCTNHSLFGHSLYPGRLNCTWGKPLHCFIAHTRIFILPGEQHITATSLCAAPSSVLGTERCSIDVEMSHWRKNWVRESSSEWREDCECKTQNWEAVKDSRHKDRSKRTWGLVRLGRALSRAGDF